MKIKFSTKISFSRIRGTDHLIDKKDGGLKCTFQIKLKDTIYFIHIFHFNPLFFNSIISFFFFIKKAIEY